jgi:phosphate transport system substrate-binding protein
MSRMNGTRQAGWTSIRMATAIVPTVVIVLGVTTALAEVRLQGAGATFPAPLYNRWVAEYEKLHPEIQIDYQSIGSGGGIRAITDKTVHFAGSDAPLSKKEMTGAGGEENLIEVPSCAGGVVPTYNLPTVHQDLNFTGELLADIYMGEITRWNDAAIAKLNPGVELPDVAITHRLAHRRFGHNLHLHPLPRHAERIVPQFHRGRQAGQVAGGPGREGE